MNKNMLCVDCNYEGKMTVDGDCPRCGSDWTADTGSSYSSNFQSDDLSGLSLSSLSTSDLAYEL
jgi:hypothetical protein